MQLAFGFNFLLVLQLPPVTEKSFASVPVIFVESLSNSTGALLLTVRVAVRGCPTVVAGKARVPAGLVVRYKKLGVHLGVGVPLGVGVIVGVAVGVADEVAVAVAVGVRLGVDVAVGVAVLVAVEVWLAVAVTVAVGDGSCRQGRRRGWPGSAEMRSATASRSPCSLAVAVGDGPDPAGQKVMLYDGPTDASVAAAHPIVPALSSYGYA